MHVASDRVVSRRVNYPGTGCPVASNNIAWEIGWVDNPSIQPQAQIGRLAKKEILDWLVGRACWPTGLANRLEELVGRTPCT